MDVVERDYRLSHLEELEAESIHIVRETAAEMERPGLLFSGGKDSAVLLHLAHLAFAPMRIPFPVVHVDTGHNFPEAIAFRDRRVAELGVDLVVASVPDLIARGQIPEPPANAPSRNRLQTAALLDLVAREKFDALLGGARRDEDRARAKERVFSFRDEFGSWDPRNQRPEPWSIYNGRIRPGESVRVFPLSNWTELDIWQYIVEQGIEVPSIYMAHAREVFERDGMLFAHSPYLPLRVDEVVRKESVRFRTVGDMTCTGAVLSGATTVDEVVAEIAATRWTERGQTRADDRATEAAMEDRKREGYF